MTRTTLALAVFLSLTVCGRVSDLAAQQATGPALWNHVFGGDKGDGVYDLAALPDGGVAVAAYTWSGGGGKADAWVLRLAADGKTTANTAYGGPKSDELVRIVPEPDGGALLAGYTRSRTPKGGRGWILRLDAQGKIGREWIDSGQQDSSLQDLVRLSDGGAIATGTNWAGLQEKWQVWVVRFDKAGQPIWQKSFGGKAFDHGGAVLPLADGGFVIQAITQSKGAGSNDLWLVKLAGDGQVQWDRTFGGKEADIGQGLQAAGDGGIIVMGHTGSKGAGESDGWVFKVSADGKPLWERTIGGSDYEWLSDIAVLRDGTMVAVGETRRGNTGDRSAYMVRLDKDGRTLWERRLGGSGNEAFNAVVELSDGRLAVGGYANVEGRGNDVWLFTMTADGKLPKDVSALIQD